MAFSSRRGRPPRPQSDATDLGTPELCLKRAFGVTQEPLDLLLDHALISPTQHWCGLHLRWLYTLRYGAPVITTRYTDRQEPGSIPPDDPNWRALREREYLEATTILKHAQRFEVVMRPCVFNEHPAFLSRTLRTRSMAEPALAEQLNRQHQLLLEGLTLLVTQWRGNTGPSK